MSRRTDRINELLREEISLLLARQIKDPRLDGVITVTRVNASNDLRSARVFISVMGNTETRRSALDGIQSAATYLRRELRGRLSMRNVPFLTFDLDSSLEEADQVLRLMDRLYSDDRPPADAPSPAEESGARGPTSPSPSGD